jgi:hypothetical protein
LSVYVEIRRVYDFTTRAEPRLLASVARILKAHHDDTAIVAGQFHLQPLTLIMSGWGSLPTFRMET